AGNGFGGVPHAVSFERRCPDVHPETCYDAPRLRAVPSGWKSCRPGGSEGQPRHLSGVGGSVPPQPHGLPGTPPGRVLRLRRTRLDLPVEGRGPGSRPHSAACGDPHRAAPGPLLRPQIIHARNSGRRGLRLDGGRLAIGSVQAVGQSGRPRSPARPGGDRLRGSVARRADRIQGRSV
ncbi:MAG: hypothetical protein AVDCRST_MAG68-4017, partial [uncultured Gemmatimonadetes bacterium]